MFCEVVCVCGWCHGYQLIYSYGYGNIRPKKKKKKHLPQDNLP